MTIDRQTISVNRLLVAQDTVLEGVGLLTNFRGGKSGLALGKSPIKKVNQDFLTQIESVFSGIESIQRENTPLSSYWINIAREIIKEF